MVDRNLYRQALSVALRKARPAFRAAFGHKQESEKVPKIPDVRIPEIPKMTFPFSSNQ